MGDVTRTIGATTGSSSTIAAAIAWGQNSANYDRATDDHLILSIVDDQEFNESNLGLTGFTGTATASKYVRLEAPTGNHAQGQFQRARVRGSTNGQHVFNGCENYAHIKNIAIRQASTGSSDECWRLSAGCNGALFEKCYVETNNIDQQDGIYAGNYAVDLVTIFDCVFKGGGGSARAGPHAQNHSGSGAQLWRIEHCTVDASGADFGVGGSGGSSDTTIVHIWNTLAFNAGGGQDFDSDTRGSSDPNADFVDGNRGNIASDTSAVGEFGTGANNLDSQVFSATDEAATEILITTVGSNYQLLDGTNSSDTALANAVDGSVRDSRIDITVDIAGNPRPAAYADRDCGAFQVVVAGGGQTVVLGLLTETGLAQPFGKSKLKAFGLNAETDMAQSIDQSKVGVIGLAIELDSNSSFSKSKQRNLGLVTEACLAQQFTKTKSKSFGQASEANTSQPIVVAKSISIGLISETNISQSFGKAKAKEFGIVSETDQALPMVAGGSVLLGIVSETDLAQTIDRAKSKSVGIVTEADLAQIFGASTAVQIGLATELDMPFSLTSLKAAAIGFIGETDLALTMSAGRAQQLGLVTESDLALAYSSAKATGLGLVTETDAIFSITPTGPSVILVTSIVSRDVTFQVVRRIDASFAESVLREAVFADTVNRDIEF